MSYTIQYTRLSDGAARIPRNRIVPKNVYRVSLYKYKTMGKTKKLVGNETTLIFVVGRVGDKVHAIKISELSPTDFFQFIKSMLADTVDLENAASLSDYLVKSKWEGDDLYNKYIKNNGTIKPVMDKVYRTYILDNMQYVSLVNFKQNVIDEVFRMESNETLDNIAVNNEIIEDQTIDERGIT